MFRLSIYFNKNIFQYQVKQIFNRQTKNCNLIYERTLINMNKFKTFSHF